jgi:hypothetical protein
MKTLLTIFIIAACLVQAQDYKDKTPTEIYWQDRGFQLWGGGFPVDTTENPICKERGHVRSNYCSMTLLANIPQYIDLPDRTLRIYHDRNIRTYTCQRCGKGFSEPVQAEPDTVVIWKK